MKRFLMIVFALSSAGWAVANVKLPKIFGNDMVLQRNKPIPVWGWADPGEKITIGLNKQSKNITAGIDGKWSTELAAEAAGGPYEFTVKGNNTLRFDNVLVGEVWICSGQSNMEMTVAGSRDAAKEIAGSNFPQIRQIKIPNVISAEPLNDFPSAEWKAASPSTTGDFTAVGYFFARKLYNELHVPIGLINTSWGGTMVETWTSREAFQNSGDFKNIFDKVSYADLRSDEDSAAKENEQKIAAIQGAQAAVPRLEDLSSVSFDDSRWPVMPVPGKWEQNGFERLDGVMWYRKTLDLPAASEGKTAVLKLGEIDDKDETYINGVKVGATEIQAIKREYAVPAGILKTGKNVIAIRITDYGNEGGMDAKPEEMVLSVAGGQDHQLADNWPFYVESIDKSRSTNSPNSYPSLLFNAMINPLIPFGIKGVLWYQGEANAGRAFEYIKSFPLMINDWRSRWKQGDFPFYFVQLASFSASNGNSAKGSQWAELREAQSKTLLLPNTGMSVTLDIGETADIHPKNKQDVGGRLAAIALNNLYGIKAEFSGPEYKSMKTDGAKILLYFSHAAKGFNAKGDDLRGFEIAGEDQRFYPAQAVIEKNRIAVFSDSVVKPLAVRYGWADDMPEANLYNKEGFPASPFRTDNWKGITESDKYEVSK